MNNLYELVSHGIGEKTAIKMLDGYRRRIGTHNGDYVIADIYYDSSQGGKVVTLKCSSCGTTITRLMVNGRNKWSELIKTCEICKTRKRKMKFEISQKNKKDQISSEIGKIYGDYVVSDVIFDKPEKIVLTCQRCGDEIKISYPKIAYGFWEDTSCHKHNMQLKYDDSFIGNRYGRLTVISTDGGRPKRFICKCDCGNEIHARPRDLELGHIKSCGCLRKDISQNAVSHDRLYHVWQDMKSRCGSPNCQSYINYGGRGISVCEEWKTDYLSFKKWAYANGYDENAQFGECTIDRIDVNGNYCPENCRWISIEEQLLNMRPRSEWKKRKTQKRATVYFDGEFVSKRKICDEHGVSVEMFNYRIKHGMSVEEALNTPKLVQGRPMKKHETGL